MKRMTILLMSILFVSSTMIAQTGTIQGIIKSKETGEPVPFASVYIKTGESITGTSTDVDGKYAIKPVRPGVHTVYLSSTGFVKMEISDVQVTSGGIAFVNIDAEVNENVLETFEVVVKKKHVIPLINQDEPSVQRILPDQLKNDVNRLDPIKLVSSLPDVTLAPNGRDVIIRGSRPSSSQFITDGMKSTTGEIGIPGQAIGSIKVYTSGIPAQYGDLTGGVIIVETKSYFDLAKEYNR